MVERIAVKIKPHPDAVLLDPCAGEGAAVKRFGQLLGVKADRIVASELHLGRSEILARNLPGSRVTQGADFLSSRVAAKSISILYLNPPFDNEIGNAGVRTEMMFLTKATNVLRNRGILVFVLPEKQSRMPKLQEHLHVFFQNLYRWEFPEEHRKFGEVVVFGEKRIRSGETREWWSAYTEGEPGDWAYEARAGTPCEVVKCAYTNEELEVELSKTGLLRSMMGLRSESTRQLRSPMELGDGHNALLLAAGHLNGRVEARNGYPAHVVRGVSKKAPKLVRNDVVTTEESTKRVQVFEDSITLLIRAATQDGTIKDIA